MDPSIGCTSLRDAAPTDELYAALERVADDLARVMVGTPTELGQRTFEALKPWSSSGLTGAARAAEHTGDGAKARGYYEWLVALGAEADR